jgi:hypothetical protein
MGLSCWRMLGAMGSRSGRRCLVPSFDWCHSLRVAEAVCSAKCHTRGPASARWSSIGRGSRRSKRTIGSRVGPKPVNLFSFERVEDRFAGAWGLQVSNTGHGTI